MSIFTATSRDQICLANYTEVIGSTGIFQLTDFTDSITGETSTCYFVKEFSVSNDNFLYTSFQQLTTENLLKITTQVNTNVYFKLRFTRSGTSNSGSLILNSISFSSVDTGDDINSILALYPKTYKSIFRDLIVANPVVQEIANNLLDLYYLD